ncbi:hypothetical protein LLE49_11850 [Alicyclobacillus tolerans]|uniref:hypothetical protein n=1 Tax=Alicyclobacillus tolerans TaxID=90970 RepID=UPI001F2E1E9C|nr:hypothetical protein [Alicyclobacillus tolerans]MCF8565410.1 hypothetical protein [Alicyclobacillus tolerans]
MPYFVSFGSVNVNTPQQNGGVFVGNINMTGMDSHVKSNGGHAAIYGSGNLEAQTVNMTVDNQELVDGVINDQDFKPVWGTNL